MSKRTIAAIPVNPFAHVKHADPHVMARASNSINSVRAQHADGYYYGDMGDSIERRRGGHDLLGGGGGHLGDGAMGAGGTYSAAGYGSFYGTGMGYGQSARYGPWASELHGTGLFRYHRRSASSSSAFHSIIASCMMAYLGHGIVRNVIDLYTDFASEGMQIHHIDKTVQRFYDAWAKKVRINERIASIFMTLFTTGQVFVHRQWATLSDKDKTALRRNNAKVVGQDFYRETPTRDIKMEINPEVELNILGNKTIGSILPGESGKPVKGSSVDLEKVETQKNRIPWGYTLLNPLQMELTGRKFAGEHKWAIGLSKEDLQDIGKQFRVDIDIAQTRINIPKELKEKLNNKLEEVNQQGRGLVAHLLFDANNLSIISGRKWDWQDWPVPFVYPSLRAISFKDCLRNMEMRACESVINSIFLFKLGDIEKGMPAEDEHFERLADMLQMPGQTLNILWNEAISAEVITADVAKLFDPRKHESADRDILLALGINEALIGGAGGKFSNSFIGAATVLERIESARAGVEEWLMEELKLVAESMGFRKLPEIRWGKTSLRDKNAERALVIQLFDRGILSADDVLEEFGTSVEIQASKRKIEKQFIKDGNLKPRGPYLKPMDEANMDSEHPQPKNDPLQIQKDAADQAAKTANQQIKTGQKPGPNSQKDGPKTGNGRPPGSKEPTKRGEQTNKRAPTGQGVADMFEQYESLRIFATERFGLLEKHLSKKVLALSRWKSKGVRHIKGLPQEEKDRLEDLVFSVFSYMPATEARIEADDFIMQLLGSGASAGIKADVLATYHSKIVGYQNQFGKEPSKEHRRQMIISAWTQSAISQHF